MAKKVEFEITVDNIDLVKNATTEAIRTAFEAVGMQAEGYAKMLCPVDTGNLRNSITHTTEDDAAIIATNVEYASYVEMGTSRQAAQPYMRPAIENNIREYEEIFTEQLERLSGI